MTLRILKVANPNALSDSLDPEEFSRDERFPYWAEIWPSSLGLAAHISRLRLPPGLSAIELGCGMGLCGTALAKKGAKVLFTDYEPEALCFARANHALNTQNPGLTRVFDWRDPPRSLFADLVIASDVIYERRFIEPFLKTLKKTVLPGGRAIVAEPWRKIAVKSVERLEKEGFSRTLSLEEVQWGGKTHPIWIHTLYRHKRKSA